MKDISSTLLAGLLVGAAAVWLIVAAFPGITRDGYLLDEELTAFVADSVAERGLPTLPSGVVYARGSAYSYTAAFAGLLFGQELPVYRSVSLAISILALLAVFWAGWFAENSRITGVLAVWLLAFFPGVAASASWARFYSLATLAVAAALGLFLSNRRRALAAFPLVALLATLAHELALVLMVLPIAAAIQSRTRVEVRKYVRLAVITALAMIAGRIALALLSFTGPEQVNPLLAQPVVTARTVTIPGTELLRLVGAWSIPAIVLELGVAYACARVAGVPLPLLVPAAIFAGTFQLGLLLWWLVLGSLVFVDRARELWLHGAIAAVVALAAWYPILQPRGAAPVDFASLVSLVWFAMAYPLDVVRYAAVRMPAAAALVVLALGLALRAAWEPAGAAARFCGCVIAAFVVVVPSLDIGISDRYLLVIAPPIVLLLALTPSLALTVFRSESRGSESGVLARVVIGGAILAIASFDWRPFRAPQPLVPAVIADRPAWLDPTVSLLRPGETVVTNDEVACLFQLGRVDFWYAESQMDVDRYRLNTATGPRGTYTGAHVLTDVNSTREQVANCASGRGCLLAVFRTGRFPFQAFEALMSEIETEFGGVVIRRAAALTLLRVSAPGLANDRQ